MKLKLFCILIIMLISSVPAFCLTPESQALVDNYFNKRYLKYYANNMQGEFDFEKFIYTIYNTTTKQCIINGVSFTDVQFFNNSIFCGMVGGNFWGFKEARKALIQKALTDLELQALLNTILR